MSSRTRATRGRPSRIARLPREIREELNRLLQGGLTQAEIIQRLRRPLAEIGEKPLSRSGLSRYATKMETVGQHLRESRELADAWIAKLGQAPTGDQGQLIIEIVKDLTFRAVVNGSSIDPDDPDAGGEALTIDALKDLALTVQRLERADEINRTREAKLRAEMAREAEKAARAGGVKKATRETIRDILLGKSA